jgi:hypothetical protein
VVNTSRSAQLSYRVGYERVPRLGVIEALHALDPSTGRAMCGRPVAISWSAEEAADTAIDCHHCLSVVEQREWRT